LLHPIKILPVNFKIKFIKLCVLIFISFFLEMVGIGMIFPIIATISAPQKSLEVINDLNIDHLIFPILKLHNLNLTEFFLISFITIYFIRSSFLLFTVRYQINFLLKINYYLQLELFKKYISKDYSFFLLNNSSNLIRNIFGEISIFVNYVLYGILTFLSEITFLVFILILLLSINKFITLLIFIIGLSIFFTFNILFKNKIRLISNLRQSTEGKKQLVAQQALIYIKNVKLLQLTNFFGQAYTSVCNNLIKVNRNFQHYQQFPKNLIEIFIITIFGIILLIFINSIQFSEAIPVLSVFAASFFKILPSINRLLQAFNNYNFGKSSIQIVTKNFDFKNETIKKTKLLDVKVNTIKFDNVSFKYKDNKKKILSKLDFIFKKNKLTIIYGPSGTGKSTIVDLVTGLLKPTKGKVLFNDINILNKDVFNYIGYIPQNIDLFDDTILNNVTLFDKNYDLKKFEKAIQKVGLSHYVKEKKLKYNEMIGERGCKISGGQKQRLGIARAIYKDPEVMIFDEPCTGLDSRNERLIMKCIKKLSKSKIVILITHNKKYHCIADYLLDTSSLNVN